jgi:cobalt-zinc-cadmium efflux system protein
VNEDVSAKESVRGGEPDPDMRLILVALSLIVVFLLIEVTAAILGDSLVLYADAGHMVTDVVALVLSAWAIHLSRKPARELWTYGFKRAEILAAAANGMLLVAVAITVAVEALDRLLHPQHVSGGLVLTIALVGVVINVAAVRILARANRNKLNVRAAFAHIRTDLFAFVGTAVSGLIVALTHWSRADSIASLLVVVLMLYSSWGLLRDSGRILLQGTPEDLYLNEVRAHLTELPHVLDVHDLHAWTLTSGSVTLSAHVIVEDHCFDTGHAPQVLDELQSCLSDHFKISHSTFQLEPTTHAAHEDDIHL